MTELDSKLLQRNDFMLFSSTRSSFCFLQEYIPDIDSDTTEGGSTIVVVSIVIEIEGDSTE